MIERVDAVVVGAGVVGLAVARALALAGREVIVLEQANAIGTGVSSRNSEVIHAGLYYPTGSLKARLCVAGREQLYDYCREHGVGHQACGKLVVATDETQHDKLEAIAQRAQANGVPVQRLTAAEAVAMEPQLHCTAALLSPATGIVDSHGLMLALQGDLERAGGVVALGSRLVQASVLDSKRLLALVESADGAIEIEASTLVNAAGLYACHVARRIRGLDAAHIPQPSWGKGCYFTLSGRSPFSRLIYPVPPAHSLGTHLTLDLGGQAKFGPDYEWLSVDDPDDIDYTVDPARATGFYSDVRRYWPGLPDGALAPGYSGVRPKIHRPDEPMPDWRIDGPAQHGVAGLVNLLGVESPGLTSCLAIGDHVRDLLSNQ